MISPHMNKMEEFIREIRALAGAVPLSRSALLDDRFLMHTEKDLAMYYAPHNEVINTRARIVIVGITPGLSQMQTAYNAALLAAREGTSLEDMLMQAKRSAGFAGSMRHHLAQMLDEIGIASALNLSTSAEMFEERSDLLHTTSIIKYPVFRNGKNYTGHAPKMEKVDMLQPYIEQIFPEELSFVEGDYLLIPLGKAVAGLLEKLAEAGKLRVDRCLFGFPHPSGANGHRVSQFAAEKERLRGLVEEWKSAR